MRILGGLVNRLHREYWAGLRAERSYVIALMHFVAGRRSLIIGNSIICAIGHVQDSCPKNYSIPR
jgi:hypothetical protein